MNERQRQWAERVQRMQDSVRASWHDARSASANPTDRQVADAVARRLLGSSDDDLLDRYIRPAVQTLVEDMNKRLVDLIDEKCPR